ncbi:MAG: hypothetical protein QNJ64_00195 [Crocosphaera sp.]|nr:hypothetical protein [Crocosphaera sp.]
MNTKYTQIFLFLSRFSRKNNKGFAMAFCLTIGVVLAATGTAMLIRSSNESKNVAAQENTARASAKADVAVGRMRRFLNEPQHRELIKKPLGDWAGFTGSDNDSNNNNDNSDNSETSDSSGIEGIACDGDSGSEDSGSEDSGSEDSDTENAESEAVDTAMLQKLLAKEWIPIDNNDPSAGDYRLRDYCLVEPEINDINGNRECPSSEAQVDPEELDRVWLQVEARAINNDSDDLNTNNSIRAVETMITLNKPLTEEEEEEEEEEGGGTDIPGLWVSDTDNGSGGRIDNAKLSSNNYKAVNADTWVDCTHNKSDSSLVQKNKIDPTPIAIRGQQIIPGFLDVRDDLPAVPPIPSSGVKNMGSRDWSDCYATLPRIPENSSSCSVGSGTDTPVGDTYYYKFTGDDSLKVNNAQLRIKPPVGKKVVIFVTGGIQVDGTGKKHGPSATCRSHTNTNQTMKVDSYIGDPDDPSKLEIYSTSNSKEVKLSGQNIISGFIHAPKTKVLISQSEIRGAVWAKEFDASNSGGGSSGCAYAVRQMDVGTLLVTGGGDETETETEETAPSQAPPTLGTIGSYRTLEAK